MLAIGATATCICLYHTHDVGNRACAVLHLCCRLAACVCVLCVLYSSSSVAHFSCEQISDFVVYLFLFCLFFFVCLSIFYVCLSIVDK